jgi:hypothetical protein
VIIAEAVANLDVKLCKWQGDEPLLMLRISLMKLIEILEKMLLAKSI